jgi:hypothetical protein
LEVLDEAARPRVTEGAFDEIFVGRTPVLMGVEPASLCWVLGQRSDNREGQTWAKQLEPFPSLEHAVTDAGSGIVKGVALARAARSQPMMHSLDVFHTLQEGCRAWRVTESKVWELNEQAQRLQKQVQRKKWRGKSLQGCGGPAAKAAKKAERALESAVEIETAWRHVRDCLESFTPEGELNTVAAAQAKLDRWLPCLQGPHWAKTVRYLKRPESLAFLERIEQQLQRLPCDEALKQDALRLEGLRSRPKLLRGETSEARAARGCWLVACVRYHRDEPFQQAVLAVRKTLRGCWRTSSMVEGINSVVRMQQARHRKLTPELINLKRFYWNCRPFRTGRRRKQSPYQLLGLTLPPDTDWWNLLKRTSDQLKQELSTQPLSP